MVESTGEPASLVLEKIQGVPGEGAQPRPDQSPTVGDLIWGVGH